MSSKFARPKSCNRHGSWHDRLRYSSYDWVKSTCFSLDVEETSGPSTEGQKWTTELSTVHCTLLYSRYLNWWLLMKVLKRRRLVRSPFQSFFLTHLQSLNLSRRGDDRVYTRWDAEKATEAQLVKKGWFWSRAYFLIFKQNLSSEHHDREDDGRES